MHIPMAYMPDATHRLQQYQKLAAADSIEEVQQLSRGWESSYGELPPETLNLCWMHEIPEFYVSFMALSELIGTKKKSFSHLMQRPSFYRCTRKNL